MHAAQALAARAPASEINAAAATTRQLTAVTARLRCVAVRVRGVGRRVLADVPFARAAIAHGGADAVALAHAAGRGAGAHRLVDGRRARGAVGVGGAVFFAVAVRVIERGAEERAGAALRARRAGRADLLQLGAAVVVVAARDER